MSVQQWKTDDLSWDMGILFSKKRILDAMNPYGCEYHDHSPFHTGKWEYHIKYNP